MTFDPSSGQFADQNLNAPAVTKVLFIDSRVPDLQSILAAAEPGVKIVVLDANHDGVQQMASALKGMHGLESIGVVSHGDEGVLLLGKGPLFAGNIAAHQADLSAIGAALGPDGDILLYGCDVGRGDAGSQFLAALTTATGADVAASSDSTGDTARDGDWNLEITTGQIDGAPMLDGQALAGYHFLLHTASVNTVAQLKTAIATGNTDGIADTITLTGNITFVSAADAIAINVTDGQTMSIVGGGFTLSGANLARVLDVATSGGGSAVAISDLTITNGFLTGDGGNRAAGAGLSGGDALGAGIRNTGTLTITGSTITANKAAGGGGAGGNTFNGSANGAGGGGSGFDTTFGGASGTNFGAGVQAGPSAGAGGRGHGFNAGASFMGGAGGTGGTGIGSGGVGSNYGAGYADGGAGATANNGSIRMGGGGGGAGYNAAGGAGGNVAGGIFNTGTLTITTSSITNNIGAGGGGGGGSATGVVGNGGAGGGGIGAIWNRGGTVNLDAATNTSLSTGNVGAGGFGGFATDPGSSNGANGTAVSTLSTTHGGTQNTNFAPPPSITSATYDASTGVLSVTGSNITNGGTIDVSKLSLTGQGGTYTLTSANVTASSGTAFTVTLSAADKIAINGVLNNNGTTSATGAIAFNLAAAANWDVTASASADLTGNAVTVSNVVAPTISSASYDVATGLLSVTGAGLVRTIGATNDITVNKLRIVGEGGTGRTLVLSSNVEITDATTFSVQLSGNDRIVVDSLLNKNGTTSTSGSTYNVVAFDDWNSSITNGDISDATNPLTVSNEPAPTIASATYDTATGTLVVTGTGFLQLTGANNDIVANKFTLTGEGGSTYTLTDTSNVDIATTSNTQFTLVLSATDKSGINQIVNKNGTSSTGGTTYNVAAAEDWTAGADAAVVVVDLTGNGITATVAAPTVTSGTYDASTGTLVVTGTGFTHRAGATNDIVANKFTLTGQGGSTYGLTDTANVEITSDTGFTLVLSTTDKAGLRTLLNNNGTQSAGGTTYNLAAADDWANGADAALNIADLVGNGITASNVVSPAITSATYDASTGVLSVTGTNLANGDTIDVSKLSITGQAGSYTLTTANVTATSPTAFAVTLNAADKLAVNGVLNNNGTTAVDTTTFNLAAATGWDTTVNATADLTSNAVTASNVTAPTITSATYDGATHVFTVTGTNLVKTIGAINDITISALTITGEGGATRTLSTTGNVEVTSATSFTFTLAGADIAAVDTLLNKNGTSSASSSTTYNLAAADDWGSVITGGNIQDLTGNGITVSNAAPSILSANYDASTGILSVSAVNIVGGDTIDVSKLSLTGQSGSYTLTTANVTASSSTAFSVTLNAADKLAINGILNTNGTTAVDTTTFNLAAAASWDATTTSGADLTGNGVTVSNVTAPTITSATYDGSTNIITVTGTDLVKTVGATNDITISKLGITGEGGATRTLLTTGNVEITSDTSFTFTLAGADIAAVSALLNKNGTSSVGAMAYNIEAADDWNSVVTDGNIQDFTNVLTVSNAAPSIISATYDATAGNLSVSAVNIVAGDTIDISKLSIVGEGAGSYTLTTSNVTASSGTSFSVTLNAADKLAVNGLLNKNGASSVDATIFNLVAAASWDLNTTSNTDIAGNVVTVSNVIAPSIVSATYDVASGNLLVTGSNLVKKLGPNNDIDASMLIFTGEGGANHTLTDSSDVEITSDTAFTLTLSATDKAAINLLANKNGTTSSSGTSFNLAAADDWNTVINDAVTSDATNGVTVSNVTVPVIASATYDAATGALVVAGTGFLTFGGANNDIDVSKLSITGEGGIPYVLTTASVEVSSATVFTVMLNVADLVAINQIVNKNGSSSTGVTTYNLSAAEDWAAGADSALVVADLIGNGITANNVAIPTIASSTYNALSGLLVVTGTGFLKLNGTTNDIVANKFSLKGEGGASYALTDTANVEVTSNTNFSLLLSAADKTALSLLINRAGSSAIDGTLYNLVAAEDWAAGADAALVIADLVGSGITAIFNQPPVITSNGGGTTAAISVAENSTAVTTVLATDPDLPAPTLSYSITGGADQTKFSIIPATGVLAFASASNYEVPTDADTNNSYIVEVSASDGSLTDTQTITVTVTDVNENPAPTPAPTPEPTPPSTPSPVTVDGTTVTTTNTTSNGVTTTILSIAPVSSSRPEDTSTPNPNQADIPLATDSSGLPLVQVGLPTGVGLSSSTTSGSKLSLRDQLIAACTTRVADDSQLQQIIQDGIDQYVPGVGDQTQVTVHTITLTVSGGTTTPPAQPIIITGSTGTGESDPAHPLRQEALIIDARNLPSGTVLDLSQVEFAIVIGPVTVIGGIGRNYVIGDGSNQTIVLGPDDDILHGGAGNDTVGSKGGNDQLFGDAGNDHLVGGNDADTLNGGSGNDVLQGGQSDAGSMQFALDSSGQLHVRYSAESTYLTESSTIDFVNVWTKAANERGHIDQRVGLIEYDYTLLKDISLLFYAVTNTMPTANALRDIAATGLSSGSLADLAFRAYQDSYAPNFAGQEVTTQIRDLVKHVLGTESTSGTAEVQKVLANGDDWGDALISLAQAKQHTIEAFFFGNIWDINGNLKLTQELKLSESGWSADSSNDFLYGGDGKDYLVGGAGNDLLDGGAGVDIAVYTGVLNDFGVRLVTQNEVTDLVIFNRRSGEQDIIRNIEGVKIGVTLYGGSGHGPAMVVGQDYNLSDFVDVVGVDLFKALELPEYWAA